MIEKTENQCNIEADLQTCQNANPIFTTKFQSNSIKLALSSTGTMTLNSNSLKQLQIPSLISNSLPSPVAIYQTNENLNRQKSLPKSNILNQQVQNVKDEQQNQQNIKQQACPINGRSSFQVKSSQFKNQFNNRPGSPPPQLCKNVFQQLNLELDSQQQNQIKYEYKQGFVVCLDQIFKIANTIEKIQLSFGIYQYEKKDCNNNLRKYQKQDIQLIQKYQTKVYELINDQSSLILQERYSIANVKPDNNTYLYFSIQTKCKMIGFIQSWTLLPLFKNDNQILFGLYKLPFYSKDYSASALLEQSQQIQTISPILLCLKLSLPNSNELDTIKLHHQFEYNLPAIHQNQLCSTDLDRNIKLATNLILPHINSDFNNKNLNNLQNSTILASVLDKRQSNLIQNQDLKNVSDNQANTPKVIYQFKSSREICACRSQSPRMRKTPVHILAYPCFAQDKQTSQGDNSSKSAEFESKQQIKTQNYQQSLRVIKVNTIYNSNRVQEISDTFSSKLATFQQKQEQPIIDVKMSESINLSYNSNNNEKQIQQIQKEKIDNGIQIIKTSSNFEKQINVLDNNQNSSIESLSKINRSICENEIQALNIKIIQLNKYPLPYQVTVDIALINDQGLTCDLNCKLIYIDDNDYVGPQRGKQIIDFQIDRDIPINLKDFEKLNNTILKNYYLIFILKHQSNGINNQSEEFAWLVHQLFDDQKQLNQGNFCENTLQAPSQLQLPFQTQNVKGLNIKLTYQINTIILSSEDDDF